MKDWQYHVLNSVIAGGLVTFGSILPLLDGSENFSEICLGAGVGIITGLIIFLNKMNDWLNTQHKSKKRRNLALMNFV